MTSNVTKYRRVAGEDDSPGGERARVSMCQRFISQNS